MKDIVLKATLIIFCGIAITLILSCLYGVILPIVLVDITENTLFLLLYIAVIPLFWLTWEIIKFVFAIAKEILSVFPELLGGNKS